MKHEITIKLEVDSGAGCDRLRKQIESLFGSGTVRESIACGLDLDEEPHLLGVEAAEAKSPSPAKPAFPVIIAADFTSYCTLQIEAASEEDANRLVAASIERDGWDSPFWQQADDWDADWQNAENLRVI